MPWGEPRLPGGEPDLAGLYIWERKIAVELAASIGLTVEEAATFAEANRPLIEVKFMARTARVDVVQEFHELMKASRMVLAAE